MQEKTDGGIPQVTLDQVIVTDTPSQSGVMWSAVVAGAVSIAIVSVLLITLAASFGFSSITPWGGYDSGSGKFFAISSALALIVIQWVSSGFGGYLTGRLRNAYVGAHTHEIFFRDTAHGFLAWALASLLGVLLLASAAMHMHHAHDGDGQNHDMNKVSAYFVDCLFMTPQFDIDVSDHDRAEAEYLLGSALIGAKIHDDDKALLIKLVSARTHMPDADSQLRVESVLAEERTDLDMARKYAADSSLFLFFSMMIGAFIASVAGGLGGQHRDYHYATGKLNG